MRYRKPGIYLQYTILPVHIDIDLYSTIGHVYGDYELTCGVTSMRPSSKQQDLSLQCRCLATPLRAAAGRKPRMMATCHHPQQRYLRSSGINFGLGMSRSDPLKRSSASARPETPDRLTPPPCGCASLPLSVRRFSGPSGWHRGEKYWRSNVGACAQ